MNRTVVISLSAAGVWLAAAWLPGVTVQAATHASVSPIKVNKKNWSGAAGFGSRSPAWYKDRSGVVHLQGMAMQTSGGPGANRIGTLPPAARPSHNVFTIVLTNGGTYADLEVARNGQLTLIAPHSPAVTDFALASLESITYRR